MRATRPTIKDVAASCGVAVSTVSNALAGKEIVTAETRARILAAAERLGYRPSSVAQAMRTGRSSFVGFVVADMTHPFTAEVARGVEDAPLSEEGQSLAICNTDYRADRQRWHLENLVRRSADGILLLVDRPNSPDVGWLARTGVPFVLVSRAHRTEVSHHVTLDNRRTVEVVLDHLWALGHRRIAFVVWRMDSTIREQRLAAYHDFFARRGGADDELIVPCERSLDGGRTAVRRLLALPERPTAIMTYSDTEALGVLAELSDAGLRVPGDMSVVSGGDSFLAGLPQIGLTAPDQPRRELGRHAAGLLLEAIADPSGPRRTVTLAPTLVIRSTTAEPTGERRRAAARRARGGAG